MNHIVIFITGAVILSLELLSSRVMTPYFGISLYIWAGILTITLIALSLGYYMGGKLSNAERKTTTCIERLNYLFLLMPAISGISIGASSFLYPKVFFRLAQGDLIWGSFMASVILLFIPLLLMAAMNPILIAIETVRGEDAAYHDHSGRVLFVSTLGSVAGVLAMAFLFIPNLTNFSSQLILAMVLSVLTLATAIRGRRINKRHRTTLVLVSAAGLIVSGLLLALSLPYLKKNASIKFKGETWKMEKEYTSFFGNTKVLRIDGIMTMYYQDGIVQSAIDETGNSVLPFTHAIELLSLGIMPDAKKALVLGLGGGIVPMRFAKKGIETDVVEINPVSYAAAKEFFNFDATKAGAYLEDARTFVKRCDKNYDIIVIDLFYGDGTPEYLITRGFFRDIKKCLSKDGVLVMNTFANSLYMDAYYNIIKTIESEFNVWIFHDESIKEQGAFNIYVVARRGEKMPLFEASLKDVPEQIRYGLIEALQETRAIDEELLQRAKVITDEYNFFPFVNTKTFMAYRKTSLAVVPREFLVN